MSSKPPKKRPVFTPVRIVAVLVMLFILALVPVCAVILNIALNPSSRSTEIEAVESRINELESQIDILNDHVDGPTTQKRKVVTTHE